MWMNDEVDASICQCAQKDLGEKSVTKKEDHPPRPDLTPPNPPVRSSTPDMGPKVQWVIQEKVPTVSGKTSRASKR